MMKITTKNIRLLSAAAVTILALAACSSDKKAEGAAAGPTETQEDIIKTSSAGLPQGRIAEGEALAKSQTGPTKQACIECHGMDGAAPTDPPYPVLAGQYADYMAHSLVAYREGQRKNAVMGAQAGHLNDQDIADLSAYFASRPAKLSNLSKGYE